MTRDVETILAELREFIRARYGCEAVFLRVRLSTGDRMSLPFPITPGGRPAGREPAAKAVGCAE